MNSFNKPVLKIYVSGTILSFEDLAANEVKNDIPPSLHSVQWERRQYIRKQTNI